MPWKAPLAPSVTSRRSLSLPTQHITKSWPSAAARALLQAGEGAMGPQGDLAQVVVLAAAAHPEVRPPGPPLGRRRAAPAVLAHPFFCLRGGAVVDGQVMATLVLEVARHGVAHDAKTEKSCFRHPVLPLVSRFRRSYHFAAPAFTNVGNKGTLASHDPSGPILTFASVSAGSFCEC